MMQRTNNKHNNNILT